VTSWRTCGMHWQQQSTPRRLRRSTATSAWMSSSTGAWQTSRGQTSGMLFRTSSGVCVCVMVEVYGISHACTQQSLALQAAAHCRAHFLLTLLPPCTHAGSKAIAWTRLTHLGSCCQPKSAAAASSATLSSSQPPPPPLPATAAAPASRRQHCPCASPAASTGAAAAAGRSRGHLARRRRRDPSATCSAAPCQH
jgi:hypothetical protein